MKTADNGQEPKLHTIRKILVSNGDQYVIDLAIMLFDATRGVVSDSPELRGHVLTTIVSHWADNERVSAKEPAERAKP